VILPRSFAQPPPLEPQRPTRSLRTAGPHPPLGSRSRGLVLHRFASRSAVLLAVSHVRPFGARRAYYGLCWLL